jgi:transketolase
MRILPNMRVFVPFLASDVGPVVNEMIVDKRPNYLRLNMGAKIQFDVAPFQQWRKIKQGTYGVVVGTGPVLENICNSDFAKDLEIWVVSIFPIHEIPAELIQSINSTRKLIVMEEHNGECGLRETLSFHLMNHLSTPIRLLSLSAKGYPSGRYGDQRWHQEENGLGGERMIRDLDEFLVKD